MELSSVKFADAQSKNSVGVVAVGDIDRDVLKRLASKYIWWKTPDEAASMPQRVIAQVMNIGDYADVQALFVQIGEEPLRDALLHAEAGQFSERSWVYWHYRLRLASVDHVPASPVRRFV